MRSELPRAALEVHLPHCTACFALDLAMWHVNNPFTPMVSPSPADVDSLLFFYLDAQVPA